MRFWDKNKSKFLKILFLIIYLFLNLGLLVSLVSECQEKINNFNNFNV